MKQTYKCSCCGKVHEEWPALAFNSPDNYEALSDEDKHAIAELSSDFCTIKHPDQTDRFIRCTLTQKVNDSCQDLDYGIWVSLSEKSFQDYSANYNNPSHEGKYFGWLSSSIPPYTFEQSVPTTVFTRKDGKRPNVIPHDDFDHPFVHDYYNGISKQEAERRISDMLEIVDKRNVTQKPWWKFW
jgi:hypothetical protein